MLYQVNVHMIFGRGPLLRPFYLFNVGFFYNVNVNGYVGQQIIVWISTPTPSATGYTLSLQFIFVLVLFILFPKIFSITSNTYRAMFLWFNIIWLV